MEATMHVLTDGGRTADLADYKPTDTIGEVADAIAANTHNGGKPIAGSQFSFKVDGVVAHPAASTADIELNDTSVLELVEVTDHDWTTPAEVAATQQHSTDVPDGTVDEVIAWVGNDLDRAQDALDVEQGRDHPRSTLIDELESVLAE